MVRKRRTEAQGTGVSSLSSDASPSTGRGAPHTTGGVPPQRGAPSGSYYGGGRGSVGGPYAGQPQQQFRGSHGVPQQASATDLGEGHGGGHPSRSMVPELHQASQQFSSGKPQGNLYQANSSFEPTKQHLSQQFGHRLNLQGGIGSQVGPAGGLSTCITFLLSCQTKIFISMM